jgi:Fuseless
MTPPLEQQEETSSTEKSTDYTTSVSRLKLEHPTANAILVIVAIIMLWRGVWELLNLYLFPGSPTFSNLLTIALGALILRLDNFSLKDLKR